MASSSLTLRSTVHPPKDGKEPFLALSLITESFPPLKPDEVLIRVEASPINPSDLGMLLAGADAKRATFDSSSNQLRAPIPERVLPMLKARVSVPMAVGNEGAGTVVAAGSSAKSQALLGKVVAVFVGGMYSQHRVVKADQCLELLPGTTAEEGASSFVNPLTVLGMIETMKIEKYKGIVHTAAASQLGQMLVKACQKDGIPLVNVVRRPEQAEQLKALGAKYVVDSSSKSFVEELTAAIVATQAFLAFDATGGGTLGSTILAAMEVAALKLNPGSYNRYGSDQMKQLYIYGGLDTSPTVLTRTYGMSWRMGAWLLPLFLRTIPLSRAEELRQRVAREIKSTFATSYTAKIELSQMLDVHKVQEMAAMSTNSKYLIVASKPNKSKL